MVKAKKWSYVKAFDGFPKNGDLILEEEDLPPLRDGEFLAEAIYISVDPYMRGYASVIPAQGQTFLGTQVAVVRESKNSKYPVGKHVVAGFGWRTHTISDGSPSELPPFPIMDAPEMEDLPKSLALGMLGMPGNTAHFAFLGICKPEKGHTVVISGAAGAVGSHVGQIAKIKGCKVIGIAGSDEKGKWLMDTFNFDGYVNYKTQDVEQALRQLAPEGFDSYYDNVGGEISSTVLRLMKKHGRICVCGSISNYNDYSVKASLVQWPIIMNALTMQGFIIWDWTDKWDEGVNQTIKWINEGKLKYKETVTEGFENTFNAFTDMLKGGNFGKAVVKI